MSVIAWIFLGLLAGVITSRFMSNSGGNIVVDSVLGVAGALVGGFVFQSLGFHRVTGFNLWSLFVAVVGSVMVLGGYHFFAPARRASR